MWGLLVHALDSQPFERVLGGRQEEELWVLVAFEAIHDFSALVQELFRVCPVVDVVEASRRVLVQSDEADLVDSRARQTLLKDGFHLNRARIPFSQGLFVILGLFIFFAVDPRALSVTAHQMSRRSLWVPILLAELSKVLYRPQLNTIQRVDRSEVL